MSLGVLNERAITYEPVDPKPWRTYARSISELISSNNMINLLDEEVLAAEGTTNFDGYAVTPGEDPIPDLFL